MLFFHGIGGTLIQLDNFLHLALKISFNPHGSERVGTIPTFFRDSAAF